MVFYVFFEYEIVFFYFIVEDFVYRVFLELWREDYGNGIW